MMCIQQLARILRTGRERMREEASLAVSFLIHPNPQLSQTARNHRLRVRFCMQHDSSSKSRALTDTEQLR